MTEINSLKIFQPVLIKVTEVAQTTSLLHITAVGIKLEKKHKPGQKIFSSENQLDLREDPIHLEVTTFSETSRFTFRKDICVGQMVITH